MIITFSYLYNAFTLEKGIAIELSDDYPKKYTKYITALKISIWYIFVITFILWCMEGEYNKYTNTLLLLTFGILVYLTVIVMKHSSDFTRLMKRKVITTKGTTVNSMNGSLINKTTSGNNSFVDGNKIIFGEEPSRPPPVGNLMTNTISNAANKASSGFDDINNKMNAGSVGITNFNSQLKATDVQLQNANFCNNFADSVKSINPVTMCVNSRNKIYTNQQLDCIQKSKPLDYSSCCIDMNGMDICRK